MTTYYVGSGGDDGNAGTSWALRKLTLNGAENIPVAAGDTVYVGPGIYREVLTLDVSGSAGSPITYIGDYTGANTDGTGGIVRITGSDNDQTTARNNAIDGSTARNYRTFQGFVLDTCAQSVTYNNGGTNWILDKVFVYNHASDWALTNTAASTQASCTVQNSVYFISNSTNEAAIRFTHSSTVDNAGHVVQNCLILPVRNGNGIMTVRVGGITVKNCTILGGWKGIGIEVALSAGQTVTVNNCIFSGLITTLAATAVGEIVENYNSISGTNTARSNVDTGANSNAYPPMFDARWFFQLVTEGAGPSSVTQLISFMDLASYSTLLNVAGTSPTTTDMRGTAVQGAQREWGALEYDSTLKIEGAAAANTNLLRGKLG